MKNSLRCGRSGLNKEGENMRNRINILLIVLIAACLALFFGYRVMDGLRNDETPPVIEMTEQIPEISVTDPESMLLQGITVHDKRDGDVTHSLVVESVSLLSNDGRIMVSFAAFDAAGNVVETNAVFRDDSVIPVQAGPIPTSIHSLISRISAEQELVAKACQTRDLELAFQAFSADPLVTINTSDARKLFDEMVENTKEYLGEYL